MIVFLLQQGTPTPTPTASYTLEVVKAWGPVVVGLVGILLGFISSWVVLLSQRAQNRAQNDATREQLRIQQEENKNQRDATNRQFDLQKEQNRIQNRAASRQFALLKSKEERDEITKKLNGFYGPLKEVRMQSRILYDKFLLKVAPKYEQRTGVRFRTLRYLLEGGTLDEQETKVLTQILQLGAEQLKLIEAQSGMVDRPALQDLLGKLGAHIRILKMAFDKNLTGPPEAFEDILFPLAVDGAIESAVLRLQDRLEELNRAEFESDSDSVIKAQLQSTTIKYYDSHADTYANKTYSVDMTEFYSRFEKLIPRGARILDAGCGAGRDTRYFIERGNIVIAFDASKEMVRKCREYPHAYCIQLSFSDLHFKEEFDAVWACASLLHLPFNEAKDAMLRLTTALKPGGIVFIALKAGQKDESSTDEHGRFFQYYDSESVKELFNYDSRIEELELWTSPPGAFEADNGREWLNLLLRRRPTLR